ncbi:MAG: hypothetical protein ACM3NQ_00330 [Bacteroidales bacterium]
MDRTASVMRWVVRCGIAMSIAALVTSGALVWLYLTNPIAVAHMVEDGVAASAARLAALVATTVIKAVRLL